MDNSKPGKTTVDSLGWRFSKEHKGKEEVTVLRDKKTGENFKFDVYKDKSKNQQRYEELGEAVKDYVHDVCLSGNLKLLKIAIPVDAGKTEPQGFFYMSEYAFYFKKLMILVHGGGAVRAGQWARSVIINKDLESGSMVPYIERALKEGFGVIVTNGNHNRDSNNRSIQGSESAQDHFVYVWNNFIKNAKTKPDIVIVAHSLGGEVVLHGLKEIDEAMGRIKAVAFTHSTHTTTKEPVTTKSWLKENARDWVCSEKPLDAPVNINCEDDCDQVSAATMDHTMTSHKAKDSIFEFFEEKLNENDSSFIKPTRFSLMSPQDRPHKQDSLYKMTSSPRGFAVIVNVKNFTTNAEDSHREGSEVDVQGLVRLFEGLDFRIKMLIDNTKAELLSEIGKISEYDFSAYDCFVVCIMSHGEKDYFLACDGKKIKIQSIREMFNNKNCETLCEKPKLFFINACRGDSVDEGTVVKENTSGHVSREPQSSPKPANTTVMGSQTTSDNADMLTVFSSVEGYYSFRDTQKGSWFISSLIEVFREYAGTEELLSMLTKVNKKVNSKGGLGEKQVPKPETTLTKKVFFWPGMKFESC